MKIRFEVKHRHDKNNTPKPGKSRISIFLFNQALKHHFYVFFYRAFFFSLSAVQANSKKLTKPQKQNVNSQNAVDNNNNNNNNEFESDSYNDDDDGYNDERNRNNNDKFSQPILSHGGDNEGTKYSWSGHKTVFSASQAFPNWFQSQVFATSTPCKLLLAACFVFHKWSLFECNSLSTFVLLFQIIRTKNEKIFLLKDFTVRIYYYF